MTDLATKSSLKIDDEKFELLIREEEIHSRIDQIAYSLRQDLLTDQNDLAPVFLGILNGSVIFLSDLVRSYSKECELAFVKIASYEGTTSKTPKLISNFPKSLENRTVIVVEDIVDTGKTLKFLRTELLPYKLKKLIIVSLLCKPEVFQNQFSINHIGFNIPNRFVIGYGLDINEKGRNLRHIYARTM